MPIYNLQKFFLFGLFCLPINLFNVSFGNLHILAYTVLFNLFFFTKIKYSLQYIVLFLIITLIFGFSAINNITNVKINKDLVEVFKPLFAMLAFSIGYTYRGSDEDFIKFNISAFIIMTLLSLLVFIPQLHPYIDWFKGRPSTDNLQYQFLRFSGTFGFPSLFGIYCGFWAMMAYFLLPKPWNLVSALLLGVGVIGSFTKSGLLSLPLLFVALLVKRKGIRSFPYIVIFISLLIFAIIINIENKSIQQIINLLSSGDFSTANHRINELKRLTDSFVQGHFFGHGPNNFFIQENYGPVESGLYYYGYKFGLLGVFLYLSILFLFMYSFFTSRNFMCVIFFGFASFSLAIGIIGESIIDEFKSVSYFPFLVGFFYSRSRCCCKKSLAA